MQCSTFNTSSPMRRVLNTSVSELLGSAGSSALLRQPWALTEFSPASVCCQDGPFQCSHPVQVELMANKSEITIGCTCSSAS
jgi:hypothetical protein